MIFKTTKALNTFPESQQEIRNHYNSAKDKKLSLLAALMNPKDLSAYNKGNFEHSRLTLDSSKTAATPETPWINGCNGVVEGTWILVMSKNND